MCVSYMAGHQDICSSPCCHGEWPLLWCTLQGCITEDSERGGGGGEEREGGEGGERERGEGRERERERERE